MINAEVLADFLRTDVQDYAPRIDEIRAVLAAKGSGVLIGNGYELELSATHAVLRHTQVKRPPSRFSVADFTKAFEAWVASLPAS